MNEPLQSTGIQLPEQWVEDFDRLAESQNVTRSAVIRALIDAGIRAHNEDDYTVRYEDYHALTVAELKAQHSTHQ